MYKSLFVFLGVSAMLSGCLSTGPGDIPFTVTINTNKSTYALGEDIKLFYKYTNTSDTPQPIFKSSFWAMNKVILTDLDDQPVELTETGKENFSQNNVLTVNSRAFKVMVDPGQSYQGFIKDFQKSFKLRPGGRYKLEIMYCDLSSSKQDDVVPSNTVYFKVILRL